MPFLFAQDIVPLLDILRDWLTKMLEVANVIKLWIQMNVPRIGYSYCVIISHF